MKKAVFVAMSVMMLIFFTISAQAQDKVATPAEAKELLKKVSEYAKTHGCEKTFDEIMKGTAFKIYKNAYPTATDFNGLCYANPKVPALVGKNLMDIKDADGKPFVKMGLEKRKKNAKDMLPTEYKWMDTKTNKVETRTMIGEGFSCGGKYGDVSLSVTYEGKM